MARFSTVSEEVTFLQSFNSSRLFFHWNRRNYHMVKVLANFLHQSKEPLSDAPSDDSIFFVITIRCNIIWKFNKFTKLFYKIYNKFNAPSLFLYCTIRNQIS